MKRWIPIIAFLLSGYASVASATPLMKYTYVDAAYQWTHIHDSGVNDANGLDSKISYTPIEHFALEGGYNYLSTKFSGINIRENVFTYGGAGWYTVAQGLDLVGRVGGIAANAKASGFDKVNDNGVYAGGTLRYLAAKDLETDLNIEWDRISTGSWTYGLVALYAIHENVALKAGADINNSSDVALTAGVRVAM